jgi:hypothetical protein
LSALRNTPSICLDGLRKTINVLKVRAFWDIGPCGLVEVGRRFRNAYCLHHQGDLTSEQDYQLQKKDILDDVSWIHSFPSPGDQNGIWSQSAQWDILEKSCFILAHHGKMKKSLSTYYYVFFSHLAPIQIHNHAYNLVGVYFVKTGYKHKWHKLYFTQQQGTKNNGLPFTIIVKYVKNSATWRISGVFAVRNECQFYSA